MSACAFAFGFTTGRWMSAIRAVGERAGGCLTVRRWFEVFNEDNLTNPIVPCPSVEFLPPAEGGGPALLVVFEDPWAHIPSVPGNISIVTVTLPLFMMFFHCFIRQCCRGNPPSKDSRPTAVGIERMETEDFLVNLALQSWQLDAGSLWELLNLSTDKGIMVTVHLTRTFLI